MPIIIDRRTGEVKAPEITQKQRDTLWGELVRNYVRKHPEEFVDRTIEDTIARDAVSLRIGINPAGE